MKRFLAMLLASVLAVGIIAFATNGEGRRTDGLYYEVTGIRPDAQIMTVDGEKVSAEEYLYWLSSQCDKLAAYYPGVDFNTQYTDSMTFGDFVKTDAQEMAKLYAIVRQWSEKYGVTLTDADREEIAQQRAQYVSYYGSEEAYQNQLRLLGISEESFNTINEAAYYYANLAKLFCNEDANLILNSLINTCLRLHLQNLQILLRRAELIKPESIIIRHINLDVLAACI